MITIPYAFEGGKTADMLSLNLEHRNIFLTGEIDDDMATSIISQLLYLDSNVSQDTASSTHAKTNDIHLYINSPGGSVSAGLSIYDVMKNLKCDVSTICTGTSASMAAILLSGGSKGKRYILPHSEVMIHQPSGGSYGQASDILIASEHIKKTRSLLNTLLSENCNRNLKEIETVTERDKWLTAEEAVSFGIVDEIISR